MAENGNKTALLTNDALIFEIRRRYGAIKDQLIGQSPEDLPRHYRLIGQQEAFKGLLIFWGEDMKIYRSGIIHIFAAIIKNTKV